jgi:iron complex outermembrane receptor protein|tara:strand:+ start:3815 stop:5995 length:2181 start_codon:yes stop_codon:yes gene_type:complete
VGLVCILSNSPLGAQEPAGRISGQLLETDSQAPVTGALIFIEELGLEATSDGMGRYVFDAVPDGAYHMLVAAEGYTSQRIEVVVAGAEAVFEIQLPPELHYTEVVSVSPEPRDLFEAYQPIAVLAGQDLSKQLEASLGATLATQPGVAERSLGPGPARPVIRGLDGDRVLILEDGQRMGDLSSQSADHGITVNTASASRIEVVRGPATLLHGSSAIGGLVNVISEQIPERGITGVAGAVTVDLGTAATEGGGAADLRWGQGPWALHASGGGRRSGDVDTPEGTVDNTQLRGASGSLGLSYIGARGYLGANYGYEETRYGVPVIEEGSIELTPRRHKLGLRTELRDIDSVVESVRASVGYRQYRHEELEGTDIGTRFENDGVEVEVLANHRARGRLTGTFGGWAHSRAFAAFGEEALSPPVDQSGGAVFAYEEVTWPHFTFQAGGRLDYARFRPQGSLLPNRDFSEFSGSLGLLFRPSAADDHMTVAISLARAARHPALEELYFFGEHPGNLAIEIGNPDLGAEHAVGFDASLRWRYARVSGELTYFFNDINDFIVRRELTDEEFEDRFPDEENPEGFAVVEFVAADSLLRGIEAHTDVTVLPWLIAEVGFDWVRGEQSTTGDPLPRMPPLRVRTGLRYERDAFQAGGEVIVAGRQDRIFGAETATDGYSLIKLFTSYSFVSGGATSTLTARLDNVTDRLYRNHLSLIKDVVPEIGRNFKLLYSVQF